MTSESDGQGGRLRRIRKGSMSTQVQGRDIPRFKAYGSGVLVIGHFDEYISTSALRGEEF